MALVLKDRVKETSTTTGTGTFTLAGAVSGFQSFSVIGNANTVYYAIVNLSASEWEVGLGTYTSSGTLLSRDTVLESSNSGSKVNFSAGTKDVFCTYPAEKAVTLDDVQTLSNKTIASPSVSGNLTFTGTGNRITGDFSNATHANRVAFQSSTTNGATSTFIIPNGTGTVASIVVANASDPTNSSFGQLAVASTTDVRVLSGQLGTGTYLPMSFYTGGSERMRIDTSGNVGIGTSSSSTKLAVVGDQKITLTTTGTSYPLLLSNDNTSGVVAAAIAFQNNGTTKASISGAVYGNDYMAFNVGSNTERVRIDSTGHTGFGGLTSPESSIHTPGAIQVGGRSNNGYFSRVSQSGNDLLIDGYGDQPLRASYGFNDGTGNVVIRTAAFSTTIREVARFDYNGTFKFNSSYGSVANAYGCRAWVSGVGNGSTIYGGGNVSSLTDTGVGEMDVNFANAMPDTNYATLATLDSDNYAAYSTRNTNKVHIRLWSSPGSTEDTSSMSVAIFR